MHALARTSVRVVLPALVLAFGYGCGGGGGGSGSPGTQGSAPAPSPAPAPAPATDNRAPTISGSAAPTAPVGQLYQFQPTVGDPDGDALTFIVDNLPPWATVDEKTGRISGTPQDSDVGEYESIVVTVADATHTTATPEFTISVTGVAGGVATLVWEQPVSKVDGSPLDDLAGYRIMFGRNEELLDHSIFIGDAAQTSYEFSTLSSGVWYFAVIGVSANGLEGPPTPVAMKSI